MTADVTSWRVVITCVNSKNRKSCHQFIRSNHTSRMHRNFTYCITFILPSFSFERSRKAITAETFCEETWNLDAYSRRRFSFQCISQTNKNLKSLQIAIYLCFHPSNCSRSAECWLQHISAGRSILNSSRTEQNILYSHEYIIRWGVHGHFLKNYYEQRRNLW